MKEPVYELFYWPSLPGRGELPRLILEDQGAAYVDVCRGEAGVDAIFAFREGDELGALPFAPPIVRCGDVVVAQSALVCSFLGERLGFAPVEENRRLAARQYQLTLADVFGAIHDLHHPIASALYYEDQRTEAARAAAEFHKARLRHWLIYFERVLERSDGPGLVGDVSYVDLTVFQLLAGLRYAMPRAMTQHDAAIPRLSALAEDVQTRPRLAAYLASERRIPFNQDGIFRHYPELDLQV